MLEEIVEKDLSEPTGILNSSSHGRFGTQKAQEVQSKASSSVGIYYLKDSFKVQLHCLMAHLDFLQSQIADVNACIQDLMTQRENFLTAIPGISQTLAATITAEIGDIDSFESPEKLAAFAGMIPQSITVVNLLAPA